MNNFKERMYKSGGSSLFDMELREVMVVQNSKEPLPTKLKHILVPFELEHAAPQGFRVCSSQT